MIYKKNLKFPLNVQKFEGLSFILCQNRRLFVIGIVFAAAVAVVLAAIAIIVANAVKGLAASRAGDVGRIYRFVKIDFFAALRADDLVEDFIIIVIIILAVAAIAFVIVTIAAVIVLDLKDLGFDLAEIMIDLLDIIAESIDLLLEGLDAVSHVANEGDHFVYELVPGLVVVERKALGKSLKICCFFSEFHNKTSFLYFEIRQNA